MTGLEIQAILAGAGVLAGLIGRALAEGDFQRARALRQQAIAEFGEENLPIIDRVVAQEVGPSAFEALRGDDALRSEQMRAMGDLRAIYEGGGMSEGDRAALAVAQNEVAQRAASDTASATQRLARVGQTGNPALEAALAATISGNAVGNTAEMGYRAQADARDRAFQALQAGAGLAGNVRGQDFAEGSARARAADAFTLFNAGQRADAINQNNANAFGRFNARMGLKDRRNMARAGLAQDYMGSAQRTLNTAAGIGGGLQTGGASAAEAMRKKGGR